MGYQNRILGGTHISATFLMETPRWCASTQSKFKIDVLEAFWWCRMMYHGGWWQAHWRRWYPKLESLQRFTGLSISTQHLSSGGVNTIVLIALWY